MRPAYLRILAGEIHRARILQIVVETVLSQMVIEEVLLHFNLRHIRLQSNRISIFQCKVPDVLEGRPLEPIRHDRAFFAGLHDSEFNREARIFSVHHE